MLRVPIWTLLIVAVLAGALEAQRGSASSPRRGAMPSAHSGIAGTRGVREGSGHRPFSRNHNRSGAFLYPYAWPYDAPYDYEEPYVEAPVREPSTVVVQQPAPRPPLEPKVIEVPGAANAATAKPLPPTVFILTNGERLETRRFMLRANDLSVTVDRHQRIIPLDNLDVDATLAANRSRGIDLEIPADPNEISLSF